MKGNYLVKLNSEYQKRIFNKVISHYGSSLKASKYLNIPASSIRGYKNLYFDSIPVLLINHFKELKLLNEAELAKNTIKTFNKSEMVKDILSSGRIRRKDNLTKLKDKIPKINSLINGNKLNLEKWFEQYKFLLNAGFRKISYQKYDSYIEITYNNFTKKGYQNFIVKVPKNLVLNNEFSYFFGLWCGDRSGGKRFGVCNKNPQILLFTENFLIKNHQKIEKILYVSNKIPIPKIDYDKKFIINTKTRGWALSIHSNNGVLSSFFHYLLSHLEELLPILDKNSFFAGLFDAEGNVSMYNRSFRWACKNSDLIKIYSNQLIKMNLFDRYDGGCLVSYNLNSFKRCILPNLKHQEKINNAQFLISGSGSLPCEYRKILTFIKTNSQKTNKEIAKALKKNKVYSELKILSNFGFISFEGYPLRYKITPKGFKSLGD